MEELSYRKRVRVDSVDPEFNLDSTDSKKIRDDLLSLLDDSEPVLDRDSVSHDLDSVIRSFEEEIGSSGSRSSPENIIDLTDDSGDVTAEVGELSGSDLEVLGGDVSEFVRNSTELSGIGEWWDLQDELASYNSFGYEEKYSYENENNNNEYVALDGIFDYSDVNLGSDFLWRPDSLPAL